MKNDEIIDLYRNDQEMIVDAFDRIVVSLFQEKQMNGHKTFTICGCNASAGSTSIAMELSISLSVAGWKTVLIDGDLRKERTYKRLNQKVEYGLSDYIIQQLDPGDVIYPTNWPDLQYISCGHQENETPVKLLCSQKMGELMNYLKQNYDFVIFDVPALNSAVDATIVGSSTDGVFLVTAAGETKFHDLETAKKQLEESGANILGVILNKVSLDDYQHYLQDYNYFSDKEYLNRSRYYRRQENEKNPKHHRSARNFFKQLMGLLMALCFLAAAGFSGARAEQTTRGRENSSVPVVVLDSYQIDGEVAPGSEFTLTLRVRNMDPSRDVRQLKIGLYSQGGGIYLGDGETNQRYLEQLRAGRAYTCEFALKTFSSLATETLPIEIRFDYTSDVGEGENSVMISPPVGKDCKVEVLSLVTPSSAIIGAKALFSMQYENSGTAELSSLKMRIQGNIVTNNQEVELKIPKPGRQEYIENSIVFTDTGTQELEVYIIYEDEDGTQYELEPQHVVTNVMSYSGSRDVYGTDVTVGDGNQHLVKRQSFTSVLQKIQTDYEWAVWTVAGLLLVNCVWQIIRRHKRARKAEGRREA